MDEISYLSNQDIVQSLGNDDLIPAYRPTSTQGGAYGLERIFVSKSNLVTTKAKTDFVPTTSSVVSGTATISSFVITEQNGIVDFACSCRFILDGGQTDGGFQFDLPTEFEPANNWANELDMYGYYQLTNPSTGVQSVLAIQGGLGSKLVSLTLTSDTAATDFKLAVFGRYNKNN